LAALVLIDAEIDRADRARGRRDEGGACAWCELGERGTSDGGQDGCVVLRRRSAEVRLQRPVLAVLLSVAGVAVRVEEVGEAVVGEDTDLRPGSAGRAVDRSDDRRPRDPLTDTGQE